MLRGGRPIAQNRQEKKALLQMKENNLSPKISIRLMMRDASIQVITFYCRLCVHHEEGPIIDAPCFEALVLLTILGLDAFFSLMYILLPLLYCTLFCQEVTISRYLPHVLVHCLWLSYRKLSVGSLHTQADNKLFMWYFILLNIALPESMGKLSLLRFCPPVCIRNYPTLLSCENCRNAEKVWCKTLIGSPLIRNRPSFMQFIQYVR